MMSKTGGGVICQALAPPINHLHGAGALFPKLEAELEHHGVGDIVSVRLLPDDAFGKRNIDLLHDVPPSELPPGENIQAGKRLVGGDEAGNAVNFTGIEDGIVQLDGNHPLAGQSLVFEIEIQAIRDASPEDISSGKVLD
ncbi:MAG: peptidylprolyl isomerase [Gammaproteobacteria bacterium]|jgi:FKBP-type peptidyl-prolyl cis-trans isomerase SlyD